LEVTREKYTKAVLAICGASILLAFIVGFSMVRPALGASPAAAPIAAPADPIPDPILDNPADWVVKSNGCRIEQIGSVIRIYGTNNVDGWGNGNGIMSTKYCLKGKFFISMDFMVPTFKGSGNAMVYMRAKSTTGNGKMVGILYQLNTGTYHVQGWGVEGASNSTSGVLRHFGDEGKTFHRMKLEYDLATETASGWIDDKFIATHRYSLTDPVTFEIFANTERKNMQIDLLVDNLFVSSSLPKEVAPAPQTIKKNLDVDFNPSGTSTVNAVFSGDDTNQQWAQTFTAGAAGVLTEIDVFAKHFLPTRGNLVMELRRLTANGAPISRSSGILFSETADANSVPQSDDGFVAFNVASRNVRVVPGDKFAVVLRAGENATTYKWLGSASNPYPGGAAFDRQDPNGNWLSEDECDMGLRTYVLGQAPAEAAKSTVNSVSSPEPVTEQERAVAEIVKLGGKVKIDEKSPDKAVVEVDLLNAKDVDAGLGLLKSFARLQSLDLGPNVTDAGLENIKYLTSLTYLSLINAKVTDAGMEHLRGLTQLQSLNLYGVQVTDAGLGCLRDLPQLRTLVLTRTQLTDAGLEHLKGLTQLRHLSLVQTHITDAGLANLKGLTQLQYLYLGTNGLTDAGLEHLTGFDQMKWLTMYATKVTDAGMNKLRRALPKSRIDYR
jgi:hypothetical protein